MPLEDVNNAFYEIVYTNWMYFDRVELGKEANAMDDTHMASRRVDAPFDFEQAPPWTDEDDLPYFNGEDFS